MRNRLMIATALAGLGVLLAQSPHSAEVQFKAAQHKQQVEGDLKGAVEQYKKIAQGSDRKLAAKALVAIGECYELLGNSEARAAYERVVREFGDQPESAASARTHLAVLSGPAQRLSQGPVTRQIWVAAGAGDPSEGAPSPDGRYLGFTDWNTGDLVVRDLTAGTDRRLTITGGWEASDAQFAEASVISSDGRQIAYGWYGGDKSPRYELRVLPLGTDAGTPPRILLKNDDTGYVVPLAWTPDGKQILIGRGVSGPGNQLAMITVQTGSITVLKSFEWRFPSKASLSPDGRYIAYDLPVGDIGSARDIFVLTVDGSRETVAVQHPAEDSYPFWSPDGTQLLFFSDRTGANSLWSVAMESGRPKSSAELVRANIGPVWPVGVTRGGALFYVPNNKRYNIYVAELNGEGKVTQAPAFATQRFVNENVHPAWSPDGQSLAYFSLRGSRPNGRNSTVLVVRSLRTGEERDVPLRAPVAADQPTSASPRWFPDGRSLLIVSIGNQHGVFSRLDLATGETEVLHSTRRPAYQNAPDLSPDGKSIFYTDWISLAPGTLPTQLLRFDLESRKEAVLKEAAPNQALWAVAVSPDGKQVAYGGVDRGGSPATAKSASNFIEVMPSGGGEPRRVFQTTPALIGNAFQGGLSWTPDQRFLLFVMLDQDGSRVLWRVPVAGGEPEKMGVAAKAGTNLSSIQVHPDGRKVAYASQELGPEEVWTLENFLPASVAKR